MSREYSMADVYASLGIKDAAQLTEVTGQKRAAAISYGWNMEKERAFRREMDDLYDDNKIETPYFKFLKAIGKNSERAALEKYDFLRDNTTQCLKETDLKSETGRLVEIKAQYNACYALVDENKMKTHLSVSVFKLTKRCQVRRPGSIFRMLMEDRDGYVMFHVYEYETLTWCERKRAYKEREAARKSRGKKPVNFQYSHSGTRWLIYPARAFAQRLLEVLEETGGSTSYTAVVPISGFSDLEISDSDFRRLNGGRRFAISS